MFRKGSLWCCSLSAICSVALLFCLDPNAFNRPSTFLFFMAFFVNFVVMFQYFYNRFYKINDPDFNKYSIGISISSLVMFTTLYKLVNTLVDNPLHLTICFCIAFMIFLIFSNLAMRHD